MAALTSTIVYDVTDFRVWPLTADDGSASPTYGTGVDVPGIAEVSLDPNISSAELKGDGTTIARRGRTTGFTLSATYGKVDVNVLKTLLGGSTSTGGTANTEWINWTLKSSEASTQYFRAAFQVLDVEVGLAAVTVYLNKCAVTGGTLMNQASESYGQPSVEIGAIQPNHATTPMIEVRLEESATTLT